jgi:RNA recognition motif-containing protein
MAKRLFVGGLPWAVTDQQLEEIFSKYGTVASAKVITDRYTGRSKGFGFVEFDKDEEADAAIKGLDQSEMEGRKIVVNVARPMEERSNDRPRRFDDRRGGKRD